MHSNCSDYPTRSSENTIGTYGDDHDNDNSYSLHALKEIIVAYREEQNQLQIRKMNEYQKSTPRIRKYGNLRTSEYRSASSIETDQSDFRSVLSEPIKESKSFFGMVRGFYTK